MKETILITGAAGALGTALVDFLRNRGCNVISSSLTSDECQLDVCNAAQLGECLARIKPSLIIHLAATFSNDLDDAYAINVHAARCLLDSVEREYSGCRVILIGSAAEYGVVEADESPISERHVLCPVSVYGMTKAWQTQLAMLYAAKGVDVLVARIFNLDGPGLSERLFIGRLQKQIAEVLSGKKSTIELGPLTATRDYISLADAVEQIVAIAEHGQAGQIYHVASGLPVTMRAILIRYLAKHNIDISLVRESSTLSNRVGYDVPVIYADIQKTLSLMKVGNARV